MIERYKDYLIHGTARVMPDSPEWRSEGTVFVQRGQGSLVQIQHLEAPSLKIDNSPKLTVWRSVGNGSIRGARYVGRIIECVTEIQRQLPERTLGVFGVKGRVHRSAPNFFFH